MLLARLARLTWLAGLAGLAKYLRLVDPGGFFGLVGKVLGEGVHGLVVEGCGGEVDGED